MMLVSFYVRYSANNDGVSVKRRFMLVKLILLRRVPPSEFNTFILVFFITPVRLCD